MFWRANEMKSAAKWINIIMTIVVLLLLIGGLIFMALSLSNGRSQTYLTISLGMICAGNFINILVINRKKKE